MLITPIMLIVFIAVMVMISGEDHVFINEMLNVTMFKILLVICLTLAIVFLLIIYHNRRNKASNANAYIADTDDTCGFMVTDKETHFVGSRQEIIRDYYKEDD